MPSASNFKCFPRSLEHFFLTVGQNNFGNKIPIIRNELWKERHQNSLDEKEFSITICLAVSTRMSMSKHLIILTLFWGFIIISAKKIEGRSISGWRTTNYPNMYNEPQRVSDERRLKLLLGFLRRNIHLTRIRIESAPEGFDGSENLDDIALESNSMPNLLYKLR